MMSYNEETDNDALIEDKREIIVTICSNFLNNTLDELSVEKSFSNTDLLLLLDDIMTSLYGMITSQIKQLKSDLEISHREFNCVSKSLVNFKDSWDKDLEKIANKIVRSQATEKTIFQMINQVDKSQKAIVNSLFYSITKCIED